MELSPQTLLTRARTAELLTSAGYPTRPSTLSTLATRGGGPAFRHFGKRVLYKWADALAWAEAKLSAPRHSTSEADAK